MTIEYPMSGNLIGKDPIIYQGNSFVWNEELNQWELVQE
jgi:hypothetical protein